MGLMPAPGKQIAVLQETLSLLTPVNHAEAKDLKTQKPLGRSFWKGGNVAPQQAQAEALGQPGTAAVRAAKLLSTPHEREDPCQSTGAP